MRHSWWPVIGLVAIAVACRRVPPQTPQAPQAAPAPRRPAPDLIALLPDPGTQHVGRAIVSSSQGRVELTAAGAATRVRKDEPPTAPAPLAEPEIQNLFGRTLAALPPPPGHFTLYFQFESEVLTDASRLMLQDVLKEVMGRPAPEVVVVGHTDTTGPADTNVALGLRRAQVVRALLIEAGLAVTAIEVSSHGEADPLVRTADGVFEPRNRRVEITVR